MRSDKKNKRGLSTIVITLIIILLSLVAIGIIWVIVSNIIAQSSKINLGILINLDITNAFEQEGNIIVDVTRDTGAGELVKIKFILFDGANSEVIEKNMSLNELESARFFIHPSLLTAAEIETVSVAPVSKIEDESESTGGITDTYRVGAISGEEPEAEESSCGNGICEISKDETAISCSVDCGADFCTANCGNYTCGLDPECAQIFCPVETDGNCSEGQLCRGGTCMNITPINIGKVEETWPGTSGLYFGSEDLPADIGYENYYVKFPGSEETDCLLIAIYRFPTTGYSKSHVGFNFATSIKTGNDYQIWETIEECRA